MIGVVGRLGCDRCDGEIGCDQWDGVARLAGHELGEGESEQRERKRAERVISHDFIHFDIFFIRH